LDRVLYIGTKNASSWALRAWLALREQEIPFEERVVDIRRPQRFENLANIATFSPPGAVPVLVDGSVVIFDSLAIMEYASELGARTLLPADVRLRAHTRSLVAWVHSGLSGLCGNISFESSFYPQRRNLTATDVIEAGRIFSVWENELSSSGGPYLAGELSLADLAFVPVVRRLLSRTPDLSAWPIARHWTNRLMSRPSVMEWMHAAEALPPVLP
jgi:glutathione S-transferase